MAKKISLEIAPTLVAPIKGIQKVEPDVVPSFKKCELGLNIGIFFDGTLNNREKDEGRLAHTNVARLYDAYPEDSFIGYFRQYVPGVGTIFTPIGEFDQSDLHAGFGIGCEARVLFGLLTVLNNIHRHSFRAPLFSPSQMLALCTSRGLVDSEDATNWAQLGTSRALLGAGDKYRQEFFARQINLLKEKLMNARPKVVCCYLDVFGFSRGAAEARVFCSWLSQLVSGGALAGVRLRLRFLGIMDTVASAGAQSCTSAYLTKGTGGHDGWAAIEHLRIPSLVENCVHMVAMHELRRNFPLDEVGENGKMPSACHQYAYPGSHSDVGGGYAPGDLGISVEKDKYKGDALKLSQIPLNHIFDCATAAGVPLSKDLAKERSGGPEGRVFGHPPDYDSFAIAPQLAKAYTNFITSSKPAPRALHQWLQPYLNWRWQVRQNFNQLQHVQRASDEHRKLLIKFNQSLIDDADLIRRTSGSAVQRLLTAAINHREKWEQAKSMLLDPESEQILETARRAPATPASLTALFDGFVHDSLAEFDMAIAEYTGYWRYRKGFLGSDTVHVVSNDSAESTQNVA